MASIWNLKREINAYSAGWLSQWRIPHSCEWRRWDRQQSEVYILLSYVLVDRFPLKHGH